MVFMAAMRSPVILVFRMSQGKLGQQQEQNQSNKDTYPLTHAAMLLAGEEDIILK